MISFIKSNRYLPILVLLTLGLGLAYSIFNKYFLCPNTYMYAFGGDALVIYYDMIYSICYDQGTRLNAMNHPHGELIFLTDAQGAVSMVLQWIHRHITDIEPYILGIVHALNVYFLIPAFLLMYYVLRKVGIYRYLAAVFAPLIILLSPQMLRFGGHYGLAYPFLIPMALAYYFYKSNRSKVEWVDAGFIIILSFFTFNNPYVGFSSALPLLVVGGLYMIAGLKPGKWKAPLYYMIPVMIALMIPFVYFKIADQVEDRIAQQWGFFFFNSSFEGMFYPDGSLLRLWLNTWGFELPMVEYESRQNIGVVNFVFITISILLYIFRRRILPDFQLTLKRLCWASFIIFTFTCSTLWDNVNVAWIEANLGFLLMFKAMARLNWSTYFVISIVSVFLIQRIYLYTRFKTLAGGIIILLALFWGADIKRYIGKNYKDSFHANFMSGGHLKEMKTLLAEHEVDTANYEAMLVVPKMMSWTDLILSTIHFNSQFYAMRISAATGLPLISAMLSRMSIDETAEGVEMVSHPWIKKRRLSQLSGDKPILVLLGKDHPPLSIGERYMTSIGDTILDHNSFTLWSVPISRLDNGAMVDTLIELSRRADALPPKLRLGFDDQESKVSLYGGGALSVDEGRHLVLDTMIDYSGSMALSCWTYIDYRKYGLGDFDVEWLDEKGQVIGSHHIESRRSNDVQDLWIRSYHEWDMQGPYRLKVYFNASRKLTIDELWLFDPRDTTYTTIDGRVMANGIVLKK